MDRELHADVLRFLTERGHHFLQQARPAQHVACQANGTAIVATLKFADGMKQVVVKRVAHSAHVPDAELLWRIHHRIRRQHPILAKGTAEFFGFDRTRNLIVMEHVAGYNLGRVLHGALRSRGHEAMDYGRQLGRAAEVLAAFHQLPEGLVQPEHSPPRANRTFLPDFERLWSSPTIQWLLPRRFRTPERLLEKLPGDFFSRVAHRVVPDDAKPKNVVASATRTCFVDPDYACGNPAMAVAQFLVGLDRDATALPHWHGRSLIRSWQRTFLRQYLESGPAEVAEELLFFYPWALLKLFEQHVAARPWSGWLFGWSYGVRLREFLDHVDATSDDTLADNLFADRSRTAPARRAAVAPVASR